MAGIPVSASDASNSVGSLLNKIKTVAVFLFYILTVAAYADDATPPDIRRFVDEADLCIHLSGELDGTNTKEQKRLIQSINQQCQKAKKMLGKLDKKYKKDVQAQEIFNQYRDDLPD